jgi:hypothetical protein
MAQAGANPTSIAGSPIRYPGFQNVNAMSSVEVGAVHPLAAGKTVRPCLLADMEPERRHPVNAERLTIFA